MMLMNQSFLRNLLVLFALCVLLIEAAPIKVRRSGAPGSSRDEVPRLPKRVVGQPFAPYRAYKKRQAQSSSVSAASSSSAASSPSVSVSTRTNTRTVTSTRTVSFTTTAVPSGIAGDLTAALGAALAGANAPPVLASLLSSALGAAVTSTVQPTVTAAPVQIPPALASVFASELSAALGGASVPPALAAQFSSALGAALGAPIATPSVSSVSSSAFKSLASSSSVAPASSVSQITTVSSAAVSASTQATGTTVTLSVANLPSAPATGTTVTVSVANLPTPVVPPVQGTSALPSVSMPPPAATAKCQETNIFNRAELHANPNKNIVLFKAVANDQATIANLVSNPNPPRNEKGDFSNTGAFYLTDTWQAAAQAACYGSGQAVDSVAVIQYKWAPAPDTKVLEFRSANTQWQSFIKTKNNQFVLNNDMIAGPADFRKDITTAFWQYAINSDKGMQSLDLAAIYQPVFCKDIPRGNCLPLGQ